VLCLLALRWLPPLPDSVYEGRWFSIRIGNGAQEMIHLSSRRRHFGGRQWYFICPRLRVDSLQFFGAPAEHLGSSFTFQEIGRQGLQVPRRE
jgi:hypothetical protein